jgi:hypothetical protein
LFVPNIELTQAWNDWNPGTLELAALLVGSLPFRFTAIFPTTLAYYLSASFSKNSVARLA